MEVCENCGLPAWAVTGRGYRVVIYTKAEKFRRSSKRTVWCHVEECAAQALAVSRYGAASHKWPITLAQFRSLPEVQEVIRRSACTENGSQVVDSRDAQKGLNEEMRLPHIPAISVRKGRPRKWISEAERLRAYRERNEASG